MDQVFTVMGVTALSFNRTKDRVVFDSEQCSYARSSLLVLSHIFKRTGRFKIQGNVILNDTAYWCNCTRSSGRDGLFVMQRNALT